MKKSILPLTALALLTGCSTFRPAPTSPTASLSSPSRSATGAGDAVGDQLFSPANVAQRQEQARQRTAEID